MKCEQLKGGGKVARRNGLTYWSVPGLFRFLLLALLLVSPLSFADTLYSPGVFRTFADLDGHTGADPETICKTPAHRPDGLLQYLHLGRAGTSEAQPGYYPSLGLMVYYCYNGANYLTPISSFYSCPEGYTRDFSKPFTDAQACYRVNEPPPPAVDPDQAVGNPEDCENKAPEDCKHPIPPSAADPINLATGNKFERIVDYVPAGASPLRFIRYYDSRTPVSAAMGAHWRHEYERAIETVSATTVKARRPDGKAFTFTLANGQWTAAGNVTLRLQRLGADEVAGWELITGRDARERYDAQGRLLQIRSRGGVVQTLTYNGAGQLAAVTDQFGRSLAFAYDAQGRVTQVQDPAGNPYVYTYDASGNLQSRQAPDLRTLTYLYENPAYPHALTGVQDGKGTRIDTTAYDAQGRAISNERGVGIEKFTFVYGDDGSTTYTDPRQTLHTTRFALILGVLKPVGLTRGCSTCGNGDRQVIRDEHGNMTRHVDFNGVRTDYVYDLERNLPITRIEAVGTPVERTISTEWHPTLRLPTRITEPGRITDLSYDDEGNLLTRAITDTASGEIRRWHYSYNASGQLISQTAPDGTGSTRIYDESGNLLTVTTTGGQVTRYSDYDANGRVGTIVAPNGRTVTLTYDATGRVLTSTEAVQNEAPDWWQQVLNWLASLFGSSRPFPVAQGDSGAAVTRYDYDAAGLLTDVSLPDGDTLHYEYDAAYRQVLARDALGNTVLTIRDAAGQPLETQVSDPDGQLVRTMRQSYDALGRLLQVQGNHGQSLTSTYDEEGRLLDQVDSLGRHSSRQYDALDRVTDLTDAAGQTTHQDYSPLDDLSAVTNARGHTTAYRSNAFGEVESEQSPDRGLLQSHYESGRVQSTTDARGVSHTYTYDADGRVLARQSPQGTVTYHYDEGEFGLGQLTGIDDASGQTRYTYNSRGQITQKVTTLASGLKLQVGYGYTLGGKPKQVATPGKHLIEYSYDAQGRPTGVVVDGQPLLGSMRFGPEGVSGWTWANGGLRQEQRDADGRVIGITSGTALSRLYDFDAGNRLTALLDTRAQVSDSFGYDVLDRLQSQQSASAQKSYTYDALGNRLQKQSGSTGSPAQTTSYQIAADSNRLMSESTGGAVKAYTYLPSGQTASQGAVTYSYDDDGRLVEVKGSAKNLRNTYNALGQRVRKTGQGSLVFAYDEAGHLLGEYTPDGVMVREYVWLGSTLVGMLSKQEPNAVLNVHTDHLGTPRAVSNGNTVLWRWEGDAFGASAPNEQVAGKSRQLTFPLRFPGQYYDGETGLHYNYFRNYDPGTGRYIESDPMGLSGGINTYNYARGNPISRFDVRGLSDLSDYEATIRGHKMALPSLRYDALYFTFPVSVDILSYLRECPEEAIVVVEYRGIGDWVVGAKAFDSSQGKFIQDFAGNMPYPDWIGLMGLDGNKERPPRELPPVAAPDMPRRPTLEELQDPSVTRSDVETVQN